METIVLLIFLYKSKADKSNKAILPGCFTKTFQAAYTTCHKLLFAIMPRLLIWKQMNKLLDGVTEGFIGMQHARQPYYVANTERLSAGCPFTSNFTSLIHILVETLLKGGVSAEIKTTMEHLLHRRRVTMRQNKSWHEVRCEQVFAHVTLKIMLN